MLKVKKFLILVLAALIVILVTGKSQTAQRQDEMAAYRNNSCVNCHANLVNPIKVSTRYFDWHQSKHRENGVSCDKCHGGNPAAAEMKAAHIGIERPTNVQSKLYYRNLPETCGSCHKEVVKAFVGSRHYDKLKNSNLGPSCTTCHEHMATKVIYSPLEARNLCASCHETVNGPLRQRPEIPAQANDVMLAFSRANAAAEWADMLVAQGERRGLAVRDERADLQGIYALLKDAKRNWHEFNLDASRKRADDAFLRSTKVKDKAWQRLMGR